MRVARWGNTSAIRLPACVVEALELREGDEIELRIADAKTLDLEKQSCREEFLARLRAFRGALPADFAFQRNDSNVRG